MQGFKNKLVYIILLILVPLVTAIIIDLVYDMSKTI